jgi:hypothetical protein
LVGRGLPASWAGDTVRATIDRPATDDREAEGLYRLLGREVVPAFFDRDASGLLCAGSR